MPKEVHLFDAPDYSSDWTPARIDDRYRPCFAHCDHGTLRGEATPIYLFLPAIAGELKRYNPGLKLIVLLRDPVERAISHFYMEKNRDKERLPLWLALLAEPFRLRRREDASHVDSHLRRHSYRRRGLYSLQLRNLYRHFDRDRVLVLRSEDLLRDHDAVLRRVFAFLGVAEDVRIPPRIVYAGDPRRPAAPGGLPAARAVLPRRAAPAAAIAWRPPPMTARPVEGMLADGEPVPAPSGEVESDGGIVAAVAVDDGLLSERAIRVNVTLPSRILALMDRVAGPRGTIGTADVGRRRVPRSRRTVGARELITAGYGRAVPAPTRRRPPATS